jgi:hypothetical protein
MLFTVEPTTGLTPVDLMDIDRILVQRGPVLDTFEAVDPAGWEEVESTDEWVLLTRTGARPALSENVSWADDGVTVAPGSAGDRVSAPDGGRVALSRPWVPGLQVRVGDDVIDADAIGGIYPVVELPAGTDAELEIVYRLPRLRLLIVALVVGLALAVVSVVTALRLRPRSTGLVAG